MQLRSSYEWYWFLHHWYKKAVLEARQLPV
jgi:hypothetical protein